ncbi:hypothetical protein Sste5346_010156 [Sporothrix stenoceras]|uniref:Xylanolytic transcriptional activator regulatory domain-containing protein n=1 Tax=Sporothrix stenoceras TaxID=5173 RepID=A0ABR3YGT5_9PEZI
MRLTLSDATLPVSSVQQPRQKPGQHPAAIVFKQGLRARKGQRKLQRPAGHDGIRFDDALVVGDGETDDLYAQTGPDAIPASQPSPLPAGLVVLADTAAANGGLPPLSPPLLPAVLSPMSLHSYSTNTPLSIQSSSAHSSAHSHSTAGRSYGSLRPSVQTSFGDSGYMQLLSLDNVVEQDMPPACEADRFAVHATAEQADLSPTLLAGFVESYLEYCYAWCPMLDGQFLETHDGPLLESPLLQQALALCGASINPPLIQARAPSDYYAAAKALFYNHSAREEYALVRIAAISLFFWWSTGAPNLANMDNAWWWTGIAIRVAQEAGLHREPQPRPHSQDNHPFDSLWDTPGLRRRIWWTLFARDRILSISQGRPAVIDQDYCDVQMVSVDDFPDPSSRHAQLFVHWVQLMEISGRVGKHLSKTAERRTEMATAALSSDLANWLRSLPPSLSTDTMTIGTERTTTFCRDRHRLYISYLTLVTLLHLGKKGAPSASVLLPQAPNAAIISASATARLFADILVRGKMRFLSGDAGWEVAVALLPLLYARRFDDLRVHAEADIHTLRTALNQMALLWPSARMFAAAFDKLAVDEPSMITVDNVNTVVADTLDTLNTLDCVLPSELFPFVTGQTSPLIGAVFARDTVMAFPGLEWPLDLSTSLQGFLSLYNDAPLDLQM